MKSLTVGATDPGRRRSTNEDAFVLDDDLGLMIVCDGIGGRRGGDEASKTVCDLVRAELARERASVERICGTLPEDRSRATMAVEMAVQRACAEVHGRNTQSGTRMGTTCTLVVRAGSRAIVGHVGDTRAYLVRGGTAHRLTEDHTMAALQIKAGVMTAEEARGSRLRGVLTRNVGAAESVQVDTLVLDLAHDDKLLLCTDGLYQYVSDEELSQIIRDTPHGDLPQRLIQKANERGGADNVTVLVSRIASTGDDLRATQVVQAFDAVRGVRLFHHMSYKEKTAVMAIAQERTYDAGQYVVREGEPGAEMFIVTEGEVQVERASVELTRLGPGGHFGEMSLMDYAPRSANVRALVPTRVIVLTQAGLASMMRAEPVIGVKLLWALGQELSLRLRASTAELVDWRRPDTPRTPISSV